MKRITQAQIARELGISQSAISLVLNNHETKAVSKEKKEHIFKHLNANKANYFRDVKNKNIGFVVSPDFMTRYRDPMRPPEERMLFALIKKGNLLRKNIIIFDRGVKSLSDYHFSKTGGLVIFDKNITLLHVKKLTEHLPVVLLNREVEELITDAVMPDDVGGMESIVSYLSSKGHKKIGCFFLKSPSSHEHLNLHLNNRLVGFHNGVKENGLEYQKNYMKVFTAIDRTQDELENFAKKTIESWVGYDPPTAVVSGDCYMASFMKVAHQMGYSIPDDFSVVGYDNNEFLCNIVHPALTSVEQHMEEMAEASLNLLIDRMESGSSQPKKLIIPTKIIERCSVKEFFQK